MYRIRTMDELLRVTLAARRFEMLLLGIFGLFAACLAAMRIYGIVTYSVEVRTKEIGIGTALGAHNLRVRDLLFGVQSRVIRLLVLQHVYS